MEDAAVQDRPDDEDPDDDDSDEDDDGNNYKDVLDSFSKNWLLTQLTHKVSARATNRFWDESMKFMPKLLELRSLQAPQKKIPKFINQRRKLYSDKCPEVKMEFAFKHKSTGVIKKVESSSAPLKALQHNENYIKLYEIASVKVIQTCLLTTFSE